VSQDSQQLQPHKGQAPERAFDPDVFRQLIENQATELEIRREENAIKKQEVELNFDHAKRVLAAQLKDRGEERQLQNKNSSRGVWLTAFVFLTLLTAICFALKIGKDAIVLELVKYIGLLLAGGLGGYSIRTVQDKKDPPTPPSPPRQP
jgi:hypothetical protein